MVSFNDDKPEWIGMHRYHNFTSDTDSDTPFSVSADTKYWSSAADTEYWSDTFPKICSISQYFKVFTVFSKF